MIKLFTKKRKGFTLVELIVVIAILGILAAIMIPRFSGFTDKARSTQALTNAKQIATAIETFEAEGKTYSEEDTDEPTEYDNADVASRAGLDPFDATVVVGDEHEGEHSLVITVPNDGEITGIEYSINIKGKVYKAIRDTSTGEFNVTY